MLKYRSDIDGLRAVAVALVLFYHYKFSAVSGGFVGVDVFFVITGFVITGLLLKTFAEGRFSFIEFSTKRIKRLLPALVVVSFISFLMISPFYMDEDYYIFSKSWLFSMVGYSNFYFLDEFAKYFSSDAEIVTLLHTWSLAIEFQFYLIWPVVLLLVHKHLNKPVALVGFIMVWVLALALSVYNTQYYPDAAYFLLRGRLFELLMGAGLAMFADRLPRLNRAASEGFSLLGLVLIIGSAFVLTAEDAFPGYNALFPTVGTALIIYAGMFNNQPLVERILSARGFVFMGALSYSVYLWHWPPVALMNYQLIDLTLPNQLLLIGFTLVASWLTYTFVEKKLRYKTWGLKKSFLTLVLLPVFFVWSVQATIRIADDISFRIPEKNLELYKIINQQDANDLFDPCFDGDNAKFDQSEKCLLGNKTADGKPNAILIGDSHATSLAGFVEALTKDTAFYTLLVTKASTPFILAEDTAEALGRKDKTTRNQALQEYLSGEPMTVFVSSWWVSYLKSEKFQTYFMDTVIWLKAQGHTVVMLEDVPTLPSSSYAYCALKSKQHCSVPASAAEEEQANFYRFKKAASQRFSDLIWVNPRQVMCGEDVCETVMGGIPLYRDDNHLNYIGSKVLGETYLDQYDSPLKSLPEPEKI